MRELLQQALDHLKQIHRGNMTPMAEISWNKVIAALEVELAKPVNEFNPDWDMVKPLVERINALEAELYEYKRKKVYKFISEIKNER